MVIPHIAYLIIIFAFIGFMLWVSIYVEKRKVIKFPGIFVVAAIGLCIYFNQFFPYVYTITDCGEYQKEILIAPKVVNGTEMTLDGKAWINNESEYYLYMEAVVYGYSGRTPGGQEIEPQTCVQAKAHRIDYIFEEPPRSISTNNSAEVRYWLDCQYEYYEEDEQDENED